MNTVTIQNATINHAFFPSFILSSLILDFDAFDAAIFQRPPSLITPFLSISEKSPFL